MVWPRIDQKSCLKAIAAAGCVPLVVENLLEGDELRTDVAGVREKIASVGAEQARTRTRMCMWHACARACVRASYCARIRACMVLPSVRGPAQRAWQVLCVLSTTSCFAPRGVERLLDLARICLELDVPHFVNNAYGVQCTACMKAIAAASKHGRLDLFIQARIHPHPTPTLTVPFVPLRGLLNYLPRPFSSTLVLLFVPCTAY